MTNRAAQQNQYTPGRGPSTETISVNLAEKFMSVKTPSYYKERYVVVFTLLLMHDQIHDFCESTDRNKFKNKVELGKVIVIRYKDFITKKLFPIINPEKNPALTNLLN